MYLEVVGEPQTNGDWVELDGLVAIQCEVITCLLKGGMKNILAIIWTKRR
jgi:hypothetical protein